MFSSLWSRSKLFHRLCHSSMNGCEGHCCSDNSWGAGREVRLAAPGCAAPVTPLMTHLGLSLILQVTKFTEQRSGGFYHDRWEPLPGTQTQPPRRFAESGAEQSSPQINGAAPCDEDLPAPGGLPGHSPRPQSPPFSSTAARENLTASAGTYKPRNRQEWERPRVFHTLKKEKIFSFFL